MCKLEELCVFANNTYIAKNVTNVQAINYSTNSIQLHNGRCYESTKHLSNLEI